MSIYFSTFISGFDSLIKKLLPQNINDVKILKTLDGAILYESNCDIEKIKKIRYFNNSFLVLKKFENQTGSSNMLNKMLEDTIATNFKLINKNILHLNNKKTFRIFTSFENKLTSVNNILLSKIEKIIEQNLHLKKDIKNPDCEFWYLWRSENIGFFMLRITYNKSKLEKGELSPELANILCLLSNPKADDVVLDPFAGSGAIPIERTKICKFKGIFALDKDQKIVQKLKAKIKKIRNKKIQKSFFVKEKNFFDTNFEDEFFNSIITDPPWGFFEKIEGNIENFYTKILEKSFPILKKNGQLILLTARKNEFENCIKNFGKFKILEKYDILVSGKKCGAYVIVRN